MGQKNWPKIKKQLFLQLGIQHGSTGSASANWAKLPGANAHSVRIQNPFGMFSLIFSFSHDSSKTFPSIVWQYWMSINCVDLYVVGYAIWISIVHQWKYYFISSYVSVYNWNQYKSSKWHPNGASLRKKKKINDLPHLSQK